MIASPPDSGRLPVQRDRSQLAATLKRGLEAMEIPLDHRGQQTLLDYLELLNRWNRAFNLTAVRDPLAMVSRHLLDSLAVAPFLGSARRVLDVGSGAGLPGIPLSVLLPERRFILLDSNGKKTRFLFQARLSVGLSNVEVVNQRIEHYRSGQQIDMVISRAFSSLRELVDGSRHLAGADGRTPRLLAMKGEHPEQELSGLPADWQASATELRIPGSDARRHIIMLERKAPE